MSETIIQAFEGKEKVGEVIINSQKEFPPISCGILMRNLFNMISNPTKILVDGYEVK